MFRSLSDRLETALKNLKGEGRISEINISSTLKEVRRALVDADVNYGVAKNFISVVKDKAMGRNVLNAVKPRELMLTIVHEELTNIMGGERVPMQVDGRPAVILMSGLQGSGKTTFSGKLAKKLKSTRGKRPLLIAGDVYRPAAIEQLKVVGESIGVPVYSEEGNKNPVEIALNGIKYARENQHDLVIVDTAGRLAVDEEMMSEIVAIRDAVQPNETLFVVDAMTGQDAVNTAKEFNDRIDFDGVILTKLDGDTRGGAAISIRSVVNKPIKYIGTGEKLDDLQEFDPQGMASRILGMGDIGELVNRVQQIYSEAETEELTERIKKNKFDFNDFRKQIRNIRRMGNIKDLASMIPGVGKQLADIDISNDAFKPIEAIIDSMTPEERANPNIINGVRRQRIAKGSGTSLEEVNRLIKQFEQMRKVMRSTLGGSQDRRQLMRQMNEMRKMQSKMRR